ncbi:hypothetical protein L596_005017 [Steinernema carpocapsae]|uniref:Protein aurora borealis n=1 Tax=Steinernema carpocapsae TaxID=34508 RepID=A0A4U8UXW6_STECR|nr:hypothetical protein L596_005017 [Steinernema carpocapsae]
MSSDDQENLSQKSNVEADDNAYLKNLSSCVVSPQILRKSKNGQPEQNSGQLQKTPGGSMKTPKVSRLFRTPQNGFRWSIEHMSVMCPAEIDESQQSQCPFEDAHDSEDVEKTLSQYWDRVHDIFSPGLRGNVAGRMFGTPTTPFQYRNTPVSRGTNSCRVSRLGIPKVKRPKECSAQTMLTIPPDFDLFSALGEDFRYEESESEAEEDDAEVDRITLSTISDTQENLPCENQLLKPIDSPAMVDSGLQSMFTSSDSSINHVLNMSFGSPSGDDDDEEDDAGEFRLRRGSGMMGMSFMPSPGISPIKSLPDS